MAERLICIWCNQPFETQDVGPRTAFCCPACEQVFESAESAAAALREEARVALRRKSPDGE